MSGNELTGIKLSDLLEDIVDTSLTSHKEEVLAGIASITNKPNLTSMKKLAIEIVNCYLAGGTTYWFGNGGSASQASHMTGELVGGYKIKNRPSLPAIALVDSTVLTALANDYSYSEIFARQLDAYNPKEMAKRDVAVGISTSGNSENIYLGIKTAKKNGLFVGYLGSVKEGKYQKNILKLADYSILVGAKETGVIQDVHEMVLHVIAESVEKFLFEKKSKRGSSSV